MSKRGIWVGVPATLSPKILSKKWSSRIRSFLHLDRDHQTIFGPPLQPYNGAKTFEIGDCSSPRWVRRFLTWLSEFPREQKQF